MKWSGDSQALRRATIALGWGVVVALAVPACRQALNSVFDVPPRAPPPSDGVAGVTGGRAPAAAPVAGAVVVPADTVVPEIERVRDPDSVLARLPRDNAGNVDWVRAVRDSVIRPRRTLPGQVAVPEDGFRFAFDFWYPGPDTTFDARFPHSVHTEWLACEQCHPRIFPYRNTPVKMADVFQGKYCGECHGKVAYPVLTGCERCHIRLSMPPNRAKAEFIGFIQMGRTKTDSGNAMGVNVDELPRATFPHWAHRMRYRCKVCHLQVFEPRAGSNSVTMDDISAGRACGLCHDGRTAFRATIGTCERCHPPPKPAQPPEPAAPQAPSPPVAGSPSEQPSPPPASPAPAQPPAQTGGVPAAPS